jgi:uncharacterized protein YneF (UPF0154 family)
MKIKKIKMKNKILSLCKKYQHKIYKFLLLVLIFSFGVFCGTYVNQAYLKSSLLENPIKQENLDLNEIKKIFPEYKNFKELKINYLGSNKYEVKFYASFKKGSSLHFYHYVLTKTEKEFKKEELKKEDYVFDAIPVNLE